MRTERFFLDSNVLVSAQLRDVFLQLHRHGHIQVLWSPEVLAETERALTSRLGVASDSAARLISIMRTAFDTSEVFSGDDVPRGWAPLPDPGDEHVLRSAVAGEADVLVSFNVRHFPEVSTGPVGVEVLTPDQALMCVIESRGHDALDHAFRTVVERLKAPARSLEEQLTRLGDTCPLSAEALRSGQTVAELSATATKALDELTEAVKGRTEAMNAHTTLLNEQAALLRQATASGVRARMQTAQLAVARRVAIRTEELNVSMAHYRSLERSCWDLSRTTTHQLISRWDFQTTDDLEAGQRLESAMRRSIDAHDEQLIVLPALRVSCEDSLSSTSDARGRAALHDRIRGVDEDCAQLEGRNIDLHVLLQDLGDRMAGV